MLSVRWILGHFISGVYLLDVWLNVIERTILPTSEWTTVARFDINSSLFDGYPALWKNYSNDWIDVYA
jgi:hypothetical protein